MNIIVIMAMMIIVSHLMGLYQGFQIHKKTEIDNFLKALSEGIEQKKQNKDNND